MDTKRVLYVADRDNNRIRYVVNGIVNTFVGGGPLANTADGFVGTNAFINGPIELKGDSLGNIFLQKAGTRTRCE